MDAASVGVSEMYRIVNSHLFLVTQRQMKKLLTNLYKEYREIVRSKPTGQRKQSFVKKLSQIFDCAK